MNTPHLELVMPHVNESIDSEQEPDYDYFVNLGRVSLREALVIEREQGYNAAFEKFELASEYFRESFRYTPTITSASGVSEQESSLGGGLDPVVLLEYATSIDRESQSSKVRPYRNNAKLPEHFLSTDTAIDITNISNRNSGNSIRWSYERGENLKAIAARTSDLALDLIMGTEKADELRAKAGELPTITGELTVAASKLLIAGMERGRPQAVLGIMESAVDIAKRANLPEATINEFNEYVAKVTPDTSADMLIEALEELEELSDLPPLPLAA